MITFLFVITILVTMYAAPKLREKTGLHLWLLYPVVFFGVALVLSVVAVFLGLV